MWKPVTDLPKQGELVVVAAWEFGCRPMLYFARMWQSSLEGQPPKWYLDPELYPLDRPREIGDVVHFWMPVPELPDEPK